MLWKKPDANDAQAADDKAREQTSHAQDDKKSSDRDMQPRSGKLPAALQRIVDKQDREDNFYNELVDG